MSTDDREEVYRSRCLCGLGEFVVVRAVPDHRYPTSSVSWETTITCPSCRDTYALLHSEGKIYPAQRDAIADRDRRADEAHRLSDQFLESDAVLALIGAAVAHLEALPSRAAMYRAVAPVFPLIGTLGTFRRHLAHAGSVRAWLMLQVRADSIPQLLTLCGASDKEMVAESQRVAGLLDQAMVPVPAAGAVLIHK